MATYPHGITMVERPTGIIPPVRTTAGLAVFFGTAPIHLATSELGLGNVNKPQLCYNYQEAVELFGFDKNFERYTLCEAIYSHFALYNVSPIVLVNVLDPTSHTTAVSEAEYQIADEIANLGKDVLKTDLVVKKEGTQLAEGTDYNLSYSSDGELLVTVVDGGALVGETALKASFKRLDPALVDIGDIIGGVDINTGDYEGLELVNSIFPLFRLLPGLVLAPKYGEDPAVAAIIKSKVTNINAHFKCCGVVDIPSDAGKADTYQKVAAWKNDNNYIDEHLIACWPKIRLGNDVYRLSTQLAGLINLVDAGNEDIPYESPSNKRLQMNGMLRADGKELTYGIENANYLNGQGVVTALNFLNGWTAWGNRTSIYPTNTDIKDAFIPVRRMSDWLSNQFIFTFWNQVDQPMTRRLIKRIVNSWNTYLNGLTAREYILGGRLEFIEDENPLTDLLDGKLTFHMWIAPPPPAEHITGIVEYDPAYFQVLFS
jgi:Phage tail sheath protein FI